MIDRRNFLKTAAVAGSTTALNPIRALSSRYQNSSGFFGVHSFIENHPDAVFIMRTNVSFKTDSEAKRQAGFDFGKNVFVPGENGGYPLTDIVAIKPNLKVGASGDPVRRMGMNTDAYFVWGIIESMKELGFSGNQFYIRETHCDSNGEGGSKDWDVNGTAEMAEQTGADIKDLSAGLSGISYDDITGGENMVDVPDGIFFKKIPYLWPINAQDSFLLNISKLKAHGMGLTVCCKNMQGSVVKPNQAFCSGFDFMNLGSFNIHSDALKNIRATYERHAADGIPRWDRPGTSWNSGLGMEMWATRTLDNISTMSFGLCIIEGIYGRDGNGHSSGPNPPGNEDNYKGEAWDYMTNVIIFGKNPVHVDIIGHWFADHEPGNFGLFHLAMEHGISSYLNPQSIPLYLWENGVPTLTSLENIERFPLMTYYLTRDYNGQSENYWHLVNEPFDYGTVSVDEQHSEIKPKAFVLHQNRPNPLNPYTSIEYTISTNGYARLEIYNTGGQLIDVLVDSYHEKGSHMVVWNTDNHSSGVYFYRFRFDGFSEVKKMLLLK